MPKKGEIVSLKVTKILRYGAFLEHAEFTDKEFFLHIKEASEKWVNSMEDVVKVGSVIDARVIGVNDKNVIQVTLKETPKVDKEDSFNKRVEMFMKHSSRIQSEIKKNNNRKFDGRKPKNKKSFK